MAAEAGTGCISTRAVKDGYMFDVEVESISRSSDWRKRIALL